MADVEVETARFPILDSVVHIEEEGAGCADGVIGSPCWKVDEPYTPIGYDRYMRNEQSAQSVGHTPPQNRLGIVQTRQRCSFQACSTRNP